VHVSAEQPLQGDLGTIALFVNYSHSAAQHTEATVIPDELKPNERIGAFGTLSFSLDWRSVAGSGFNVGLYGTNLTNNLYRVSNSNTYLSQLYGATLYGEPRMYGVRLRYEFGS
jgi:iron complex outermembrane receptor protein